jgi:hypothetical protein
MVAPFWPLDAAVQGCLLQQQEGEVMFVRGRRVGLLVGAVCALSLCMAGGG